MELHRGRLIDHLHLVVADIEASRRFYAAVFEVLEIPLGTKSDDHFQYDELYVSSTKLSATHEKTGRHHLAFATRDKALVDACYKAGLAAGGRDNGAPGERTAYHPGYYGAFLLDPDGNNIEVVFHGPATYSAASVQITF
jgi:catechol 2,3-dioxygenase-like lactoylglutathione lyase family enzyme